MTGPAARLRPAGANRMAIPDPNRREVLFEFTAIGSTVKVSAIDAATGIEVSVMGPTHASRNDLQKLAVAKLKARLASHFRS